MKPADIERIERELGFSVPADYRRIVTDYPAALPDITRGYDLLDHPDYVISENSNIRRGPVFGIRWPNQYFVIGSDGAGGLFCLDLERAPSPVIYFDHDDRSFREVSPTLEQWLPSLIELHAAGNA